MTDKFNLKKFTCDECGVEFSNIFDYLREHEEEFSAILPLGNIGIDLMDVLKDLYELLKQNDTDTAINLICGIGAAFYAHSTGHLQDIVDEIILDEKVEKATRNMDVELRKILRKANDERFKD